MLGKFLKHEFKATARYFLVLYVFIIILTPLFSLAMRFADDLGTNYNGFLPALMVGVGVTGYVVMMIGIFAATFVLVVLRFYKTTATSEAYLTFTLPVKPWHIVFSKMLTAFVWELATGALAILSIFCMMFISGVVTPAQVGNGISEYLLPFLNELGFESKLLIVIVIFSMIMGILSGIGRIYFAISLGQLFQEHRIMFSIGFYFLMYIVIQFLSTLIQLPFLFILSPDEASDPSSLYYSMIYLTSGIEGAILAFLCFFGSAMIYKKHLNVK